MPTTDFRFRTTVTTENVHEPETFVQVLRPQFLNGFLVLESIWDTYLIRADQIREIRITEDPMALNYDAVTYAEEIKKKREARDNTKRDLVVSKVHDAINALEEYVDLPDQDDQAIHDAIRVLEGKNFSITRVGDVDENGECRWRIIPKVRR